MHDNRFDHCSHLGIDLGDKSCFYCGLDDDGQEVTKGKIRTTPEAFSEAFCDTPSLVIAIEVGTHSPWICRLLESFGHEVLVANPRRLPMIFGNTHKSDELDAQNLARLARYDRKLLCCIRHRSERSQRLLALLHSRDQLVRSRTELINHVHGVAKSSGCRLPRSSSAAFHKKAAELLPADPLSVLEPILIAMKTLSEQIRACDRVIESWSEEVLPVTKRLREITGVGPITAAAFVLTLDDPSRFASSRQVGAYLGLAPRKRQSGDCDHQTRITKAGNAFLRRLLVNASQHILCRGPDCDLRRFGERIHARGGPRTYRTAVIAVARKLAVRMHRLWVTGDSYEPLRDAS
jgi:transposase